MNGQAVRRSVQGGLLGLSVLLGVVVQASGLGELQSDQGPVSTQPSSRAQPVRTADFGHEPASAQAQAMAHWVMASSDHEDRPFVVVDKINARVFVFDRGGRLLGAAFALLGLARGDDAVPGLGSRPLSQIQPHERITPAGRFVAELDRNVLGQAILWVDYEQAISLHPVRSLNPQERRLERLASPSAQDKRISYGCINVPTEFWTQVVQPAFWETQGVVYILPDHLSLNSVFPNFEVHKDAAVVK